MTTLPQTTTSRLPRPATAPPLMVPAAAGGPIGPQGSAGQMTGADIWRVIRANLWLIIIMLVFSAIAGYGLNWYLLKFHPRFTAEGWIHVEPSVNLDPLEGRATVVDRNALAIELRTHAQMLRNEALVSQVLRNPESGVQETKWYGQFGRPDWAKDDLLRKSLRVSPIPDTQLILVTMSAADARDAKTIVEAIGNQHLTNRRSLSSDRQSERSRLLRRMKSDLEIRRSQIENEVADIAVRLNIDGMGTPGRYSALDAELAELTNRQIELGMAVKATEDALEQTTAQMQAGMDPSSVEEFVRRDPSVQAFQQAVYGVQAQIDELSVNFGPGHSVIKRLVARRDAQQRQLDGVRAKALAEARVAYTSELRSRVTSTKEMLDGINTRIDEVKRDMGGLSNTMSRYVLLMRESEYISEQLKEIDSQLNIINQVQSQANLSGVTWASTPLTPDLPSFPRLPITMTLAVVLGLALSLGIAFLREMMDTSIRSPRDIARVGQMTLLGMIPDQDDDPQAAGARLPLVIFEAPHSLMAEQFRQVRTRLHHAASLDTTRSILVTSPGPGDGKSTIAANLAAGLALNGRRILLVDANFRRPELHRIFGMDNERGFSDVLNSLEEFDQVVQETNVPNLAVLTTGVRPANPTELLESQLFIDFIERVLEEYDHVVFDSGPLLFVSESIAMAPRVDGVVTVVRARTNSRGLLQRMRDGLRQIKAEHLGVVLNAVQAQGGGYYGRNIKTYYAYQNGRE